MTLEQRIAAERDARLAEKCGELALALAKSNEMIARLTRERDDARAKALEEAALQLDRYAFRQAAAEVRALATQKDRNDG